MTGKSTLPEMWLERRAPTSRDAAQLPPWMAAACGASVFLHGNGVIWAQQAGLTPDVLICSASWQRRFGQQTPGSGALSSLMVFWARALSTKRLIGGEGSACAVQMQADSRWLLSYRGDATKLARQEALELVMAGASLDLDLRVVLEPPAWQSFCDDEWQAWLQLVDHQLARLCCLAERERSFPEGVEQCTSKALDALMSTCRSLAF